MNRLLFMFLMLQALCSCQAPPEKKPNFVFILVDDLGWADIGANWEGTFYETPHIDALASVGVRFSHAYSAHPVCSPTRAALMTGKHPNRVNITDWIPGFDRDADSRPIVTPSISHELALEEVTLAEKFKEGGYQTFFVGKWHLGEEEAYWPEFQGFDVNIGGWSVGAPQLKAGVSNGYFSPYGNPRLADGPEGEYLTDRLTAESIRLMKEAGDNPFLLYLSYYTVHTPIQPVPRHHDRFKEKLAAQPHVAEGDRYQSEGVDGVTRLTQDNTGYASMVAAMDENIGEIMGALKELGLEGNTWVIFTSDNGGLSTLYSEGAPTSNGPLRAGKGWCYEGGIRVPLLIAGPNITGPGRVVDESVVSMDYFTTMLSLAGITHEAHDGNSLVPLLIADSGNGWDREELFWHYPHYHGSAWRPGSALRKGKWKLIYYYENDTKELFDLERDPKESTDLSSRFPDLADSLQYRLFERLHESGAKFPVRKGDAAALPAKL